MIQNAEADTVLPRADYNFEITGAEHAKTQNGKDMFKVRCRVIDGPHKGTTLTERFVLSPESSMAMSIFFRHMRALGLNQEFFRTSPSPEQVVDALIGRRFRGGVNTETYQGEERNVIKQYTPLVKVPGAGGPTPPPPPPAPASGSGPVAPERAPF
jgi:hypothetical protein